MCANPARHRAQRKGESFVGAGFWAARELLESTGAAGSARHARRGPSKYALHIGRVGALAVSLGVGLAVANANAAVAYADSESDAAVSGAKSESASPHETPPAQDEADGAADDDEDSGASRDEPGTEEPDHEQEVDPPADDPDAEPVDDEDDETTSPENSGGTADTETPADKPAVEPTVPTRDLDETDATRDEPIDDSIGEPVDDTVVDEAGEDDSAAVGDVAVVDVVRPVAEPVERAAAASKDDIETVDIVSTLVSTVVSPFANPNAPAPVPWFDALLAWVRRQITHTFSNKTPVYGPITVERIFTGQYFIDLNATDPNGDPLTYEIIQPKNGLVVRDLITGKFVYTPTTVVTGAPLQDTFQVVIRDDSEHLTGALGSIQKLLHGVARLFGLAQKDNVTVTIPITLDPIVQLPPTVVTAGLPVFKLGNSPVKVLSSVIITDADSDQISKATIRIATSGQDGDVLAYAPPAGSPITATWDAATKTLTLSGLATADQYEQALLGVTFTATKGGLPRGVAITVTDDTDKQSLVPGAAVVTVIGLPPAITVGGLPIFRLGGAPVKVVSSVSILDGDSQNLSKATLTVGLGYKSGDVLNFSGIDGNPITASWDAATRTLTLSGVATIEQYETAIKAVTFTATEGGLSRTVSVSVTDDTDKESLVPGAAVVTVIGLPPAITVGGLPIFRLGGAPVKVVSSVSILDGDSDNLSKATLTIGGLSYRSGDVLSFSGIDGNPITASWDAATRTLTLSGVASIEQYEAAIKAVTFTATEGGLSRSITVSVVDDTDKESLVPGAAVVTVIGLPPAI
ncbi:Ig-like domain-containing protein, partial [Mycobacterium sp. 4D054]|uniref:Ig-like domain-containing protein n=1 Tax=Mycobacterium sp. 4D054 TaxID=3457440 RepID=UPI003FD27CB4